MGFFHLFQGIAAPWTSRTATPAPTSPVSIPGVFQGFFWDLPGFLGSQPLPGFFSDFFPAFSRTFPGFSPDFSSFSRIFLQILPRFFSDFFHIFPGFSRIFGISALSCPFPDFSRIFPRFSPEFSWDFSWDFPGLFPDSSRDFSQIFGTAKTGNWRGKTGNLGGRGWEIPAWIGAGIPRRGGNG